MECIINGISGVLGSCVVGILEKENKGNHLVFGFVVKDPSNKELTEDSIISHVHSRVDDAKKIRGGVHLLHALPLSRSGKIMIPEVKKLAMEYYEASLVQ